jgi:transcriptional regulator with XRE-family HTH domain
MAQVIGHNVKTRREQLGMTGDELGQRAGGALSSDGKPWPRQTVYMVERGERAMAAAEVAVLAEVLDIPIAQLFQAPSGADVTAGTMPVSPETLTGRWMEDSEMFFQTLHVLGALEVYLQDLKNVASRAEQLIKTTKDRIAGLSTEESGEDHG